MNLLRLLFLFIIHNEANLLNSITGASQSPELAKIGKDFRTGTPKAAAIVSWNNTYRSLVDSIFGDTGSGDGKKNVATSAVQSKKQLDLAELSIQSTEIAKYRIEII